MESPLQNDVLRAFLLRIYTLQNVDSLVRTLCETLTDIVPGEKVFIGRHNMAQTLLTGAVVSEPFSAPDFLAQVNDHAGDHPLWEPIRTGGQTVRALSDHASGPAWHENGLYRELLRYDDVEDHLSIEFGSRCGMLTSVGIFRRARGFREEEKRRFEMLIPHIELALQNARIAEAAGIVKWADEQVEGQPLLQVQADGSVSDISPRARALFQSFFGARPGELPVALRRWLRRCIDVLNRGALAEKIQPLLARSGSDTAEFRLYRRIDVPDYWLGVRVSGGASSGKERVQRLSPREWEVIRWVREGKSNEEIAALLGVSFFTVKTHLKNIFRKLGVRTRTEAVMALEGRGACG